MAPALLDPLLERALDARAAWLADPAHESACRLFHGFAEGCPALAVDLYAATVVLHDYAEAPADGAALVAAALPVLRARLPWLRAGVLKTRRGPGAQEKRGVLLFGDTADRQVREHGVWYAIDLQMNRDASLYLDTRNLRQWAIQNLRGRRVLNTFAYTGSLGVAALAGGAAHVVQLDRNPRFLEVARASGALNALPDDMHECLVGDFFPVIARLKRSGRRFDCVVVDPPFFSATDRGVVDLATNSTRLINKVRPLINDGGSLVVINNALFVSGRAFHESLETLCADGYLEIAELIPVPDDFTGTAATRAGGPPITDPAPFNHATKIAVLRVRRKAQAGDLAADR